MEVHFDIRGDSGTAPKVIFDLFSRGVEALFRNFDAGRGYQDPAGISGVVDRPAFVRAVRVLTDAVYAATGWNEVVDASAGNAAARALIDEVYADAAAPASPAELREPVFVVGVPRSGTTWVQNMLQAHPTLAGPRVETSLFVSLEALWGNEAVAAAIGRDALAGAIRRFVSALFAAYAPPRRLVEKTPLHGEHVALIAAVFPDAAFLSVHRDGRDVVRSLLEMESGTDDVVVAATRWAEITRTVSAALAPLPRARNLRYETLLVDPVAAMADVFEWLGLDADDAVLAEVRRRAAERVSQYNTTGDVGSGKWKSLSRKQLRAVYRHAGDRLNELGYTDR